MKPSHNKKTQSHQEKAPQGVFLGFLSGTEKDIHKHPDAPFRISEGISAYDQKKLVLKQANTAGMADAVAIEAKAYERMQYLQGSVIPRLVFSGEYDDKPCNVFEAIPGAQTLTIEYLRSLSIRERMDLIEQDFRILAAIHEAGILQGDRALANMVVDENGQLYNLDFSSSVIESDEQSHTARKHYEQDLQQSFSMSAFMGHAHAAFMTSRMELGMPLDTAGEIEQEGKVAQRMLFVHGLSMDTRRDLRRLRDQLTNELTGMGSGEARQQLGRFDALVQVISKMTDPVRSQEEYDPSQHYQSMEEVFAELEDMFPDFERSFPKSQQEKIIDEQKRLIRNTAVAALNSNEPWPGEDQEFQREKKPDFETSQTPLTSVAEERASGSKSKHPLPEGSNRFAHLEKKPLDLGMQAHEMTDVIPDILRLTKSLPGKLLNKLNYQGDHRLIGTGVVSQYDRSFAGEGYTIEFAPGNQTLYVTIPQANGKEFCMKISDSEADFEQETTEIVSWTQKDGKKTREESRYTCYFEYQGSQPRVSSLDIEEDQFSEEVPSENFSKRTFTKQAAHLEEALAPLRVVLSDLQEITQQAKSAEKSFTPEVAKRSDHEPANVLEKTPVTPVQKPKHFTEQHIQQILEKFPRLDEDFLADGGNSYMMSKIGILFDLSGEEVQDLLAEYYALHEQDSEEPEEGEVMLA